MFVSLFRVLTYCGKNIVNDNNKKFYKKIN